MDHQESPTVPPAQAKVEIAGAPLLSGASCVIEGPLDPCTIVIVGACGDLTRRKIVRALYRLYTQAVLPDPCLILGTDLTSMSTDDYRRFIKESVETLSAGEAPAYRREDWDAFASRIHYVPIAFETKSPYQQVADFIAHPPQGVEAPGNRLFYLAVPPGQYVNIVRGLGEAGLAREGEDRAWSRVIIEKPFGNDLASAQALNRHIQEFFSEHQIFRIDHYLAKETVQNVLMLRFANAIFEPVWNRRYVDYVRITAAETLGVEHRAAYYEGAGVLRDMFQNHILQLLAMAAMEPPSEFQADRVRDERVKVFRSLRPFPVGRIDEHLVLGQYAAGTINGRPVAGYRDEPGVAADSVVPTYAMARVFVDNWRWQGVPFYLCSGKRLAKKVTEIAIRFKPVPKQMFRSVMQEGIQPNVLILGIQPDERITLTFQTKLPGAIVCLQPVTMDFHYSSAGQGALLEAYEKVILDCLLGDHMLFVRQDGVEQCWAFLSPILEACETCDNRERALHFYEAGTWGPAKAQAMIGR